MQKRKKLIITSIILIIMCIITLTYYILKPRFIYKDFKKNITIEYKSKYNKYKEKVCIGNILKCKKLNYKQQGNVDTSKLGKYKVKYIYKYKNKKLTLTQTINVVDKTKPIIDIENEEVLVCPNNKIQNINIKVSDNYDTNLEDKIEKVYDEANNKVTIKVKDSNNNETTKIIDAIKKDEEKPTITLNGNKEIYLSKNTTYKDQGVTTSDNCDDNIKVDTINNIDYNKPGKYTIKYIATDSSGNKNEEERIIYIRYQDNNIETKDNKVVYLTFDDGPSEYTNELLDILKKHNVKATFFVTGHDDDNLILREYKEGHKIALHTNSHSYSYIYKSINNYFDDLYAVQNRVERITGQKTNLIRFPGGSSNTVSRSYDGGTRIMSKLTKEVTNRGFKYFDWNVSSGDGGGTTSTDQVYLNVTSNLKEGSSIVLQHDTQKYSIDAVDRIITYCKENGYTFKTLNENSPSAHHGVNN